MRSVPDGFLIQVLINIFYSIYIFINSLAIFCLCQVADGYQKGMGGGGGEREEGREGNSYISDALVLCRPADLLILLFF